MSTLDKRIQARLKAQALQTATDIMDGVNRALEQTGAKSKAGKIPYFKKTMRDKIAMAIEHCFEECILAAPRPAPEPSGTPQPTLAEQINALEAINMDLDREVKRCRQKFDDKEVVDDIKALATKVRAAKETLSALQTLFGNAGALMSTANHRP